jgi:outer membrane protein assembly factor BamB
MMGMLVALASWRGGPASARGDDWPQWQGPQRNGEWRESGILRKFPANGPVVLWRAPIGPGYSGPAVANGRVFVCDRIEANAATNSGTADLGVNKERVLCLNEANGKVLWQYPYDCKYTFSYPAGPRTTPTVVDNKVYTLGAEARLCCLDAQSGAVLWSKELKKDYQAKTPIWGFAGHPLVDGNKIFCTVGGKDSLVVALDKDTGKELWHALDAREIGYCPPIIFEAGGRRQLAVFYPEGLASLDPETGKVFWTQPYSTQFGLTVSTPRKMDDLLFVTSFYNGPMMVRLAQDRPEASLAWKGKSSSEINTDSLHSIISTPFLEKGRIYGVCSYGQLRCLNAQTGERLWETFAATTGAAKVRWANAFLVKNGDVFFLANESGDLIIARLNEKGYQELSRAHLLEPTNRDCGRLVVWSHPAFADKSVIARNDKEIIRVSLAE